MTFQQAINQALCKFNNDHDALADYLNTDRETLLRYSKGVSSPIPTMQKVYLKALAKIPAHVDRWPDYQPPRHVLGR